MAGYEAELTASLRERGELPDGSRILAAWSGFLVELTGTDGGRDLSDRPVAIFGITARSGHVLSRLGILSFDITQLRGPHSPYPGYLRFAVLGNGGARIDVGIAVDGAVAIAGQLAEATPRPYVGTRGLVA